MDVIDSKVRELQELENIMTQASRNNMDALNTMSLSIAIKMMEGKTV